MHLPGYQKAEKKATQERPKVKVIKKKKEPSEGTEEK